ncbi:MAG: efflux RND transporter periplasmic adaptor subunit [Planctomycetaceae bacterium]|jgi:Cu(I)/Ag(I) efflux system membrane fusion protein|nr:efflux RND transporter periplasmic adaptor subunit [Planctomycetaceae bacterium]
MVACTFISVTDKNRVTQKLNIMTNTTQNISNTPNTKRNRLNYFLLIFVMIVSGLAGWFLSLNRHVVLRVGGNDSETSERKIIFYQSPMHPWIKSDKPGKCTICGMALAPVYEGDAAITGNSDFIKLTDMTRAIIGVTSTPARIAPLKRTLRVAGIISDDETQHRILSAQAPGRIEKLYINQVGIDVVGGQPLAEIYSPELQTAQRLYLEKLSIYSTNSGAVTYSEFATARENLLLLGMLDEDIKKLDTTQKPDPIIVVRNLAEGTVISRKAYEGQYVNVNDELFEIGNFSSLWFVFDAYESSLPFIRLNQKVTVLLPSFPEEIFAAPITFIDPSLNNSTRTARVRVVISNPQKRILNRQTANGIINIETEPLLIVPRSSILYTRNIPVAYVDLGDGAYQLRNVQLGKTGDDDVEIISGIKEGEKVVTQSALLIDSQTQLAHITDSPDHTEQQNESDDNKNTTPKLTTPVILPDKLIEIMNTATAALSSDNLAEYQKQLPTLIELVNQTTDEVHEILVPLAAKLTAGKDLKDARQPFEPFSNSFADIVRLQPAEKRQAKIFQCPMSPVLGTARWIQNQNNEVLNPFFGSEMLNCGVELQ